MGLGPILAVVAFGHNGVVHNPGEASAIGVSADLSGAEYITIYNYGQNYVYQYDWTTETSKRLWWPKEETPIAATIISSSEILALADTRDGYKFQLYNYSSKSETLIENGSCDLNQSSIKFIDPINNRPTFIFLDSGKVKTYDKSTDMCDQHDNDDYPLYATLGEPLFPDATFYGYAKNGGRRCWFLGTKDSGARVECFDATNAKIFSSKRLDDGYRRKNDHTCGDIFFAPNDFLYVANGDTDPGNLREGRQQDVSYYAGKLIRFETLDKIEAKGIIQSVGFRNPWTTASSDNRRFVGQVGQHTCETVYEMDLSNDAHENYGWPKYEGRFFRSAVTPYRRDYPDAKRVFTDSHRTALPPNYMFVLYILFFTLFAIGVGLVAYRRTAGTYATFELEVLLLIAFLCIGLPQMTFSSGYTGNDNGVYNTHMRTLVHSFSPIYNETYPEYFVMVFFLFFSVPLLISAVYWSSPPVAIAGSLFGFIYLVTFMALIEAPAMITPLPIFAFIFILVVIFIAFGLMKNRDYTQIKI